MSFSKESISRIKAAKVFVLFSDARTKNGHVYFIVAKLENEEFQITNEDGSRSESDDRFLMMGAIQALRPELETHDFLAGVVLYGPCASDLDRELSHWLLSLSGRALSSLDDVELMAVSEGYEKGDKLGVVVSINDTSEPANVIQQNLRKRDRQSPLLKSGAIVRVSSLKQ